MILTPPWIGELPRVALALLPVLLFLATLRVLDRYELVTRLATLSALTAGAAGAALCYAFNTFVFQQFPECQQQYARFGAPVIEESAKSDRLPGGAIPFAGMPVCEKTTWARKLP
jgi:hypothetical protein